MHLVGYVVAGHINFANHDSFPVVQYDSHFAATGINANVFACRVNNGFCGVRRAHRSHRVCVGEID